MSRTTWVLAFVALFALAGVASAQTTPAPASPQASTPAATLLAQIFEAPATGGISTVPEPVWKSCTVTQCIQPCKADCREQLCTPACINTTTCLCGCNCN